MRVLSPEESMLVSGGIETITVSGQREVEDWWDFWSLLAEVDEYANGGSGSSGSEPVLEEVVVTAAPMTTQEQQAYDLAAARAENNLTLLEVFGVGGLAWLGNYSSVLAGLTGYTVGRNYSSEERAEQIERMTEAEYLMDGLDGSYDGQVTMPAAPYGAYP
jgi:hypothetical protein